ncbi:MAG: DUF1015 domain-containing protein [Deltaproteobacteria bacterium]|nr:DUF1015 domain-containing protein [Deltaproteobacteria bacterium]
MSAVVPFRALRPQKDLVKAVASLPYDVLSLEEAKMIAGGNPLSFLHVEKSEIDLPSASDENPHDVAVRNLKNMMNDSTLFQEEKDCFYIYRQKMQDREQYGVVGCVSCAEYESGRIKKHEMTTADKEKDRTDHVGAVNAQTGPVFLTYKALTSVDRIVAQVAAGDAEYDFVSDDGIMHTVWVIRNEAHINALTARFADVENLYIADGHHRAAAAAAVARIRRGSNPAHTGDEAYNYMLAVLFPDNQLHIMEYNRVVKDLHGLSDEAFLSRIGRQFQVSRLDRERLPRGFHDVDMYLSGQWYRLRPNEGSFDDGDLIGRLDVNILLSNLLQPILGIQNPRTDQRIAYVGGARGTAELEKLVDSGAYAVAFALFPTSMEQLIAVADAGMIMPPKSTWFEPKLRSGIFVHLLS